MDHLPKNVPLVQKPNIYKEENVRTPVIQDSMKMKNSTLVNHVIHLAKNVQPEPNTTVLNVMRTHTWKKANVNQFVKLLKYMKMMTIGNVNHVTALVQNVHVLYQLVVPNVLELSTIMKEHVSVIAQMDITKILKQTLVIYVTLNV